MKRSCWPRMQCAAFTPEKPNRQLNNEVQRFFAQMRNMRVLPDREQLRMPGIPTFYIGAGAATARRLASLAYS